MKTKARKGKCTVCGRSQKDRPTCFQGEVYCSDNCRKALTGEKVHDGR